MRKKTILFLALLLAIAMFSAIVMAEETDNAADAEMNEAAVMHVGLGAQVRLLQLEKSIIRNYVYGEKLIDYIKDKSLNTSSETIDILEDIVSELKDLKAEVVAELDKEPSETTVETFVSLKDKSINLTLDFRSIIRDELTVEHRSEIKSSLDKEDFSELKEINDEIKERVKEFNKKRLLDMLVYLNITDEELFVKIDSGNITVHELKKTIMDKFRGLPPRGKMEFLLNVKHERTKVELFRHVAFARKLGLNMDDFRRLKSIADDDKSTSVEIKARLGAFVKEKVEERKEVVKEIKERVKEVVKERREIRAKGRADVKAEIKDGIKADIKADIKTGLMERKGDTE